MRKFSVKISLTVYHRIFKLLSEASQRLFAVVKSTSQTPLTGLGTGLTYGMVSIMLSDVPLEDTRDFPAR